MFQIKFQQLNIKVCILNLENLLFFLLLSIYFFRNKKKHVVKSPEISPSGK
jgi:hypothetical protein